MAQDPQPPPTSARPWEQRSPSSRARRPATATSIAPPHPVMAGVWRIPLPLVGSALGSVNAFLLQTQAGPVLIDAGYAHRACEETLRINLDHLGFAPRDLVAVLLTHNHPDHVGLARRLATESGAQVALGREDDFDHQRATRGGFLEQLAAALAQTGAPADVAAHMLDRAAGSAAHPEDLTVDIALDTGHTFDFGDVQVQAIHTPGHTYGHTAYVHSLGVVFTGDTMMATGPTQLALRSKPHDHPAQDLVETLSVLADLDVQLACPAHGLPYGQVRQRARDLSASHQQDIDTVHDLMERYDTAWEVARQLPRERPWHDLGVGSQRFALVHTHALMGPR